MGIFALAATILFNGCGGGGSSTPSSPSAPSIVTQPGNRTVTVGQTATFTVAANNATSYQWYEEGTPITGATATSHTTLPTTTTMNGHTFKVVATGPGGSVTSTTATLTVQYYSITTHPADATMTDGGNVTFAAAATGNPSTATYQWQRQAPGSTIFVDLAGQTSASYTTPALVYATDNGAKYRRKDIHVTGTYFTNAATLTVSAIAPAIVTEPSDRTVQVGQATNFSFTYSGTVGTIQWFRKPLGGAAVVISGQTGTTYSYTPSDVTESGNEYYATVTNPSGPATTRHAVLTVTPAPTAPHFTVQPQDQTGHVGQTVTFTATASGVPTPTYTWKKNGTLISGETSNTLSVLISSLSQDNDQYICVANNGVGGDVNSNVATLHALPALVAPWFTTSASNQTVTVGSNVTFAWVAGGNPTPTGIIQEYIGSTWTTISTGFALTLNNVQLSDSGRQFRCAASNSEGNVNSTAVTLTVNPNMFALTVSVGTGTTGTPATSGSYVQGTVVNYNYSASAGYNNLVVTVDGAVSPASGSITMNAAHTITVSASLIPLTISSQPANKAVTAGATATFTITATGGTAPYHYQWKKNGSNVGTDSSSYSLVTALGDNGASITCVVTDSATSPQTATSNAATLTVNPTTLTISSQPASKTVTAGTTATFTITATGGTAPYHYQWKKNGTNVGTDSSSYSLVTALGDNNALITCVVTDSATSPQMATSSAATLTVNPTTLTIRLQPLSQTVTAGQTATFAIAVAGGTPGYHYQWKKNGSNVGTDSTSYSLATVLGDNNASITCVVTDSAVSPQVVTSNTVKLMVNSPLTISTQPANQTVTVGQMATFTIAATGGTPVYHYQWKKNGSNVGTDSTSFSLATVLGDNNASITCVVTDSAVSPQVVTSNAATLTVNPTTLTISSQPTNQTVTAGATATFTITATGGTAPYHYQWKKNGSNVGTDSSSYSLATVLGDNGAIITCVVTDGGTSPQMATSNTATLMVNPASLAISSQPASKTVTAGATATFAITATGGTAPYHYQWKKNGTNVGTDSSSYSLATVLGDNGAIITCVVTDSATSPQMATSNAATLTVNPTTLTISSQPTNQTVTAGATATFTITATGGTAPYHYQWKKNGSNVGTDSSSYSLATVLGDNGASITCVVTDSATSPQTATSNTVTLTVNPTTLTISSQPASKTVTAGATATFTIVATGGTPGYHYQWKKNGSNVGTDSATYSLVTVLGDNGASINCIVTDSATSPQTATSNTATLAVSPAPLTISTQPANQTVQDGQTATFSLVATGGTPGYHYQWKKNGVNVGGDAPSFIWGTTLGDNGASISCVVTDSAATPQTATSSTAILTVTPAPLTIDQVPNMTVFVGQTVNLALVANGGTGGYHFQWKKNGSIVGTDSPSYSFVATLADNKATLSCVVTDSATPPQTASTTFTLTVDPTIVPADLVVTMNTASDSGQFNNDAITASDPVYTITIGANTTDVQMNVDSTGWVSIGLVTSKAVSGLADGTHTVSFRAMNGSTPSALASDMTVTIMKTAPAKVSENFPNLDVTNASGSGTLVVTQQIPAGYGVVSATMLNYHTNAPVAGAVTATANGTNSLAVSYTTPNTMLADIKIRFVLRNAAGVQATIDSLLYTLF